MSLPHFKSHKESEITWLGRVPSHWDVSRLGFNAWVRARLGWKGLKAEEYVEEGYAFLSTPNIKGREIDFEDVNFITEDRYNESPEIKLAQGDVLLAKDGSTLGIANVIRALPRQATVNSSIAVVTPRTNLNSIYLYYLLCGNGIQQLIQQKKGGMGVPHLFQSDLVKFPIPLPPSCEQLSIARFLDHETAKIDALITEQQRLIELLQEKRQAVISHAVTKGLNPNAPMKDSGVEWLGEVPEHWETGKIKHYFRTTSGSTPNSDKQELYYTTEEDEQGTPWIRTTDIDDGEVKAAAVFITPKALGDTACKPLPVNTVLVALYGGGGTVGKNGILKIEAAVNQALCGILPSPKALPEYVHRYIQFLRPFWMERAVSARKAGNISQELVGDTIFPMPPIQEQTAILRSIEEKLEELDELAVQSSASLGLLEERRSALISAAVTGQIDVRGLVEGEGSEQ